jgi:hypothetical protein
MHLIMRKADNILQYSEKGKHSIPAKLAKAETPSDLNLPSPEIIKNIQPSFQPMPG